MRRMMLALDALNCEAALMESAVALAHAAITVGAILVCIDILFLTRHAPDSV